MNGSDPSGASATAAKRLSTGWPELDAHLGGGLLPGTLTLLVGATGIGKTQLGVRFAHAGAVQEGRAGAILDLGARGDSQNHAPYAQRLCDWEWPRGSELPAIGPDFFAQCRQLGPYRSAFERLGRRVTRDSLDAEQWDAWQRELNRRLEGTIAFLYGHLCAGSRRIVLDGIEPVDRPEESVQLELIEYLDHQLLHKEAEWVARDVFRQHYRELADQVAANAYDHRSVAALALCTSHELMLDDLLGRPLRDGDLSANANTLIYLGKIRRSDRLTRGLCIAKHRGSACTDEILEYRITERGPELV